MLEKIKELINLKLDFWIQKSKQKFEKEPHQHSFTLIQKIEMHSSEYPGLPIGTKFVYECTDPSCKKIMIQKNY